MSIFEKASRIQLRFSSAIGTLSVEDLWKLPISNDKANTDLDRIAIAVDQEIKASKVSFVTKKTKKETENDLRLEILMHIIEVRQNEADAHLVEKANKQKAERIRGIIESKKNSELENLSIEELTKMEKELV